MVARRGPRGRSCRASATPTATPPPARSFATRLAGVVEGRDALAVAANWQALGRACRNLGRPGLASMAIAAVDTALWDLKARLLDLPLATLLDAAHDAVPDLRQRRVHLLSRSSGSPSSSAAGSSRASRGSR